MIGATDMELMDAIRRRRTVRDYDEEDIPYEVIEKALRAGLMAPSYNHQKEWAFVLVRDLAVRRALVTAENASDSLPDGAECGFEGYELLAKEMYLTAIPKQKRMILTAPALLVVVYKPKTPIAESKRIYDSNGLAAVWCCVENILLSLAEDDVYATTMVPQDTPAVKDALGIPRELEVAAMIPMGYRASDARIIPSKEVTVASVLHTDRW
jgi:nitroreductase